MRTHGSTPRLAAGITTVMMRADDVLLGHGPDPRGSKPTSNTYTGPKRL